MASTKKKRKKAPEDGKRHVRRLERSVLKLSAELGRAHAELGALRARLTPEQYGPRPLTTHHFKVYAALAAFGTWGAKRSDIKVRGLTGKSLQRVLQLLRQHGKVALVGKRWIAE